MVQRFRVTPLPAQPNLEHQQKLAKRLLRDVWAGDADAIAQVRAFLPTAPNSLQSLKLHDAQRVIARGYGFESWLAMKRKIESLTKSPLERFDIAVREGDAEAARELLSAHAEVRARINDPALRFRFVGHPSGEEGLAAGRGAARAWSRHQRAHHMVGRQLRHSRARPDARTGAAAHRAWCARHRVGRSDAGLYEELKPYSLRHRQS